MDEIRLGIDGIDYDQIRPLGSGGMGDIFLAHKKRLNINVIIKRTKPKFANRVDQANEANLLKKLRHQYLPAIYDVIVGDDGMLYTVMDYIPGMDLQKYVRQHGPVDQRTAYKWALELCEVTKYLHSQHPPIIHCDIKPRNVMVRPDGTICLIDFNTSFLLHGNDEAIGASKGYAAPEQYHNSSVEHSDQTLTTGSASSSFSTAATESAGNYGPITVRTDIYAIGATLYFALTGYAPERSIDTVTPITDFAVNASEAMQSIIVKAMKKMPQDRFSSCDDMLKALQNIVGYSSSMQRLNKEHKLQNTAVTVLWIAGFLISFYGIVLMHRERGSQYAAYISDAENYDSSGKYEAAQDSAQKAIDMTPEVVTGYLSMAETQYHEGSYKEAIATLEDAFDSDVLDVSQISDKDLADAYFLEGNCWYELGEYDKSVNYLTDANEKDSQNAEILLSLALAEARSGDLDKAEAVLKEMQAVDDSPADSGIVLAEIAFAEKNYNEAHRNYSGVYDSTDDLQTLMHAYIGESSVYDAEKNYKDEAALLEKGVENIAGSGTVILEQKLADAYGKAALQYKDQSADWYTKQLAVYEKLKENKTFSETSGLNMANAQMQLKNYSDCEKTLLGLQKEYPDDYRIDMRLAFAEAALQNSATQDARDYGKFLDYYNATEEKYETAKGNGIEDTEMISLENLMQQVKDKGWIG